ncbi:MAG: OmpA family protein, partial [Bacteroidia bacterium]|nr:OmpA family protein [Bacteroidia bacterium]
NRLVAFLELNPRVKIEISGHTDNTGNRDQKIQLSVNRATAVKEYLEQKGIPHYRMSVKGYGMYRPRATNNTEEGRRLNRRVEFTVTNM